MSDEFTHLQAEAPFAPIPAPPLATPLPPAPAPKSKAKWRAFVPVVVVLALVGGVFAMRALKDDPPKFPTFTEVRPTFGTIRVRTDLQEMLGNSFTMTTESDAAGSVVHVSGVQSDITVNNGVGTTFELIVSADEYWSYSPDDATWVKFAQPDANVYTEARYPLATLMVSDYVPDSLRPYVTLVKTTDETVSGQAVKVYDLRLDVAAYQKSGAADYQQWADNLGITTAEANTTLELAVDANGVVWRMRSFETLGTTASRTSTYEQLLEKLLPEQFVPEYPTSYYDEATGQQVG